MILTLHSGWLASEDADDLLTFTEGLPWEQGDVVIFGRKVPQPRRTLFYALAGVNYTYSGLHLAAVSPPDPIFDMMMAAGKASGTTFNSVLLNRYNDGQDSIGWHSDDEPELGPNPIVTSLSLGQGRDFCTRPKHGAGAKEKHTLGHGDLCIMEAGYQRRFQHSIPKRAKSVGVRVSLTFRTISS